MLTFVMCSVIIRFSVCCPTEKVALIGFQLDSLNQLHIVALRGDAHALFSLVRGTGVDLGCLFIAFPRIGVSHPANWPSNDEFLSRFACRRLFLVEGRRAQAEVRILEVGGGGGFGGG